METAARNELLDKVRGSMFGDYESAFKSLITAFEQRKIIAKSIHDTGDEQAIEAFYYINDLIKKALFL